MKYLYTIIAFLFLGQIWADEGCLYVKCPENYHICINGITREGSGTHRKYLMDCPKDKQLILHVFAFTDRDNRVLYSGDVPVESDKVSTIDIRDEETKKTDKKKDDDHNKTIAVWEAECKKIDKSSKPNFGLFNKDTKESAKKALPPKPKKEEPKENIIKIEIVQQQQQYVPQTSFNNNFNLDNCPT